MERDLLFYCLNDFENALFIENIVIIRLKTHSINRDMVNYFRLMSGSKISIQSTLQSEFLCFMQTVIQDMKASQMT